MLTRDQILSVYAAGPEAVVSLFEKQQEMLLALSARVQELERRLGKDSHNSSKPPSSDGLAKKSKKKTKTSSLRQSSGNKTGGQPGHGGTTLTFCPNPSQTLVHAPSTCTGCGASLQGVIPCKTERRQVHELPPLSLLVTEHQAQSKRCPCCQSLTTSPFPSGVCAPVQYGPHLQAFCVYLQHYQLLPFERTRGRLLDLLGTAPSEGTLAAFLSEGYGRLEPIESAIKQAITEAEVAHFDETGARVAGRLHWLHQAGTASLTYFAAHAKRGKEAIDAIDILPRFTGCSVHDFFVSYLGYKDCAHSFCNGHLLRELIALKEQSGQPWPEAMIQLLLEIKKSVLTAQAAGSRHLSSATLCDFERRYAALVCQGFAANPAPVPIPGRRGRRKQSAARNLLCRLDVHRCSVLAFMYHFDVPFDNNLAERDLRMIKVHQKVSGCFRSLEGAAIFCRIRGYLSTLRKQGYPILAALQSVFAGEPRMPALAT